MNYSEAAQKNKWIILILIIAAFLRFYHLGFQGAWLDELHTLKESDPNLTLSEFHQTIMFREGIPHFYFLTVRFLSELLGSNIVTARLVSAISGILAVLFIYVLGKALYDKRAGYISALLLTVNIFHIEYSQEARSYAMLAFFVTAAFYFLVRFVKNINLKNAVFLGLFTGLITNAQPIGLVNVVAIYAILLIVLISAAAKDRKKIFLYSFVSGIVTLLVFSPVIKLVLKVSEQKSMWIPAPTFDSILQVFVLLSGRSLTILLLTVLFAVYMLFMAAKGNSGENKGLLHNKALFAFMVLLLWIGIEAGVIIIKSYTSVSIVLHRYFIALLPALMLVLGIGLALIQNRVARTVAVALVAGTLAFNIFSPNNYYTTRTKSQYDKVCEEVMKRNTAKDKIVSNWGWLLTYYLNRDNKNKPVLESSLDNYADDLRNGAVNGSSFWYIDGNSRPYALSPDLEKYLNENFIITDKIEECDAWARHYKAKKQNTSNSILDLTSFESAMFDGAGTMIFVENKTVKYPPTFLESGRYKLVVKGQSLPEKPINNENAHFNVIIDGNKIGEFSLSEKKDGKDGEVHFEIKDPREIVLQLNYDNDIVVGADDRNGIISVIKILKE